MKEKPSLQLSQVLSITAHNDLYRVRGLFSDNPSNPGLGRSLLHYGTIRLFFLEALGTLIPKKRNLIGNILQRFGFPGRMEEKNALLLEARMKLMKDIAQRLADKYLIHIEHKEYPKAITLVREFSSIFDMELKSTRTNTFFHVQATAQPIYDEKYGKKLASAFQFTPPERGQLKATSSTSPIHFDKEYIQSVVEGVVRNTDGSPQSYKYWKYLWLEQLKVGKAEDFDESPEVLGMIYHNIEKNILRKNEKENNLVPLLRERLYAWGRVGVKWQSDIEYRFGNWAKAYIIERSNSLKSFQHNLKQLEGIGFKKEFFQEIPAIHDMAIGHVKNNMNRWDEAYFKNNLKEWRSLGYNLDIQRSRNSRW